MKRSKAKTVAQPTEVETLVHPADVARRNIPTAEMAACIRHSLNAEDERRAMTEAAWRFVHEEASLQRSTERILGLMEDHERNNHP